MEKRLLQLSEVRASGDKRKVSGYAATYNTRSGNLGGFYEQIASGAFDRVLRSKPDCVLTINHDASKLLARTASGTLRLSADSKGLAFDADLPNTSYARDLSESLSRGDLNSCSFAFSLGPGDDDWSDELDEERSLIRVRTIRNFNQLHDCAIVSNPAYPGTSVDARYNVVAAEVRSYVARTTPRMTQEQINEMVDNRDLEKYPLSGSEILELIQRRRAVLEEF